MNLAAYCKTGQSKAYIRYACDSRMLTKTLMVMKLTAILMLVACLQVSAAGYSQRVSLSLKNVPLEKVFKEIEKQSGYSFWYKTKLIKAADKVSINIKDASLEDVLKKCLENQLLSYYFVDQIIVITQKDNSADNQPPPAKVNVKGRITDSDGKPLAGVSVTVKSTKRGTTTDSDGAFFIEVLAKDVLIFSYVGYDSKEITVGENPPFFNITLTGNKLSLNDVVVVGYGKNSRKNLSTAVSSVKPEDLNHGAIGDVGQLLQGKVSGLNVTASGDPNRSAAVILRGVSTLNSSQGPFYVIDGIPGADIATIAPDDIASIDILKDAAATAIYGNQAANGVIMVTTKRGKKGQMQVAYNGYVGAEKVSNQLKMMNAAQLRDFVSKNNLAFTPADDLGANTNWQKEIERSTAVSTNHNLSFGGGTEHSTYNASINYLDKQGILLNSDLKRFIGRLAIEQYALNDKVKFGLNVSNSNSSADDIPYRNTVLLQSALYLPVSPVKNADGSYFENFVKTAYYNPVAMINNSQMNTKYNLLIGNFTTEVKLPFDFTYNLSFSYQNSSYLFGSYLDSYFTSKYNSMYDNPDPGYSGHTLQTFGTNGQATRSSFQDRKKIFENYLTWSKKIGAHDITAVAGYAWQDNIIGDGFSATTSNFPVDNTGYNNLTLSNPSTYGSGLYFSGGNAYQHTRLISDFARLNYSYNDKYLLQASLRRDGGSVFGKNNQWGYFPSVSVAWKLGNENFMQSQHIFSDLKIRGSYGVTGNASGFNAYTAQFISGSRGTYYYNGVGLTAAYGPTQAANVDLQWEKIATTNIGIDFTILNGKVNGSLDWYNKNTTGMIYGYAVNPVLVPTGSITANGGSINNKGVELSLFASPVKTAAFSWTTSLNVAHNKNVITSLRNPLFTGGDSVKVSYPEGSGQSGSSLQILKEGHPLGQFFTLEYAGKDANGVSQFVAADGKSLTTSPTTSDYHYAGDAQPKLLVGWANTFRYKNFDLNIFIRGVFGNKIFNATKADLFRPTTAMSSNILVDAANESPADDNAYRYSTRFIENGSYVRFDNATLGYNFSSNRYFKSLRLYTSVNNLFVITKFTGVDPEVNQGGIAPGVDYNNFYPKTRTFLLGVNVSF